MLAMSTQPQNTISYLPGGVPGIACPQGGAQPQCLPFDMFAIFGCNDYLTKPVCKPSRSGLILSQKNIHNPFIDNSSSSASLPSWPPPPQDSLSVRDSSSSSPCPLSGIIAPWNLVLEGSSPSTPDTAPDGSDEQVHCLSQHCLAKHANYIKERYTPEVSPVLYVPFASDFANSSDSNPTWASSQASSSSSSSGNGRGTFVAFSSPGANGVTLADILSFKPECMLGADDQVLQDIVVKGTDCWIKVIVKGALHFKDAFYLPINCECSVVTRAKVAWDIAMVLQVYLNTEKILENSENTISSVNLADLRLRSLQKVSQDIWHIALIHQRHSEKPIPSYQPQNRARGGRGWRRGRGWPTVRK